MNTKKNKQIITTVVMLFALVLITTGISYAFFIYMKIGSTYNSIKTGNLTFIYDEQEASENGINMITVLPISDTIGKNSTGVNNVFDFQVLASAKGASIQYEVIVDKQALSTLPEGLVKIHATTVNGELETAIDTTIINNVVATYSSLSNTTILGKTGKTIYQEEIPSGKTSYNKQFRLRMWLSESASEQTDGVWNYNDKSFSVKVNVIANGVKTVPPIASKPELDASMIPVYYDGNTLKKAGNTGEWYNYDNKEWANAILVRYPSLKTYQEAAPGTIINTQAILAYFVWVPRYRYKLFNVEGKTNYTPQEIEIVFENKNTPKSVGTKNGEYLTPPGFTHEDQELNGFWIGKFEMTGNHASPTTLPSEYQFKSQTVSTFVEIASRYKGSTTGLSLESKMIKNSEWAAVAYLSHSKYGINKEIRHNNTQTITGCGALIEDYSTSITCKYEYGKVISLEYPQTTTGNITGVFDMSGGLYEYVMGVLADSTGAPRSGTHVGKNSGFNGMQADGSMYRLGIVFPSAKYYDLYTSQKPSTSCDGGPCLGAALVETSGWYNDQKNYITPDSPWILRGGTYTPGNSGIFAYNSTSGGRQDIFTSRVVIIPNK